MKIHVFISLEATDWNDYSDIDCSCCEDHHNASVHEAGTDEIVEEHWDGLELLLKFHKMTSIKVEKIKATS